MFWELGLVLTWTPILMLKRSSRLRLRREGLHKGHLATALISLFVLRCGLSCMLLKECRIWWATREPSISCLNGCVTGTMCMSEETRNKFKSEEDRVGPTCPESTPRLSC